jgi:hypothetical protein
VIGGTAPKRVLHALDDALARVQSLTPEAVHAGA